ncbi:hypothetical protein E2C01_033659 [Portunus trituberculatus]|uniref:Uncharacterized protein n=1 Tax=Portunus trituberculatus TaxID=210409 RepID=A0A5B7F685_PORTR|nr:hypothetical protein [Portunus trituberculatus]
MTIAEQVQIRNNNLSLANEALQDQIRDLRHNLYMKEEVDARRRRWQLSRLMHAQEAQRR